MNMKMNVLELYSGIGGMHMAARDSDVPVHVVSAVDINTSANSVYRHSFPETRHLQRNIESLTADELDKLKLDFITMSPPCQPFSRLGRQADTKDARTSSLMHVLQVLPRMRNPPRYLLLENVRGFERSEARAALLATLRQLGLCWRELLLSPVQLGVPNSRTRYYLMARRDEFDFQPPADQDILTEMPYCVCGRGQSGAAVCCACRQPVLGRLAAYMADRRQVDDKNEAKDAVPTLAQFLAGAEPADSDSLLLSDATLSRYGELLDVVTTDSRRSCCFTSGYGHLVEGAGSVLMSAGSHAALDTAYAAARRLPPGDPARAGCLQPLRLRRFSPREAARLMCFPDGALRFPEALSDRQRYRLVGNSVNVRVVAAALLLLLHADVPQCQPAPTQPL